MSGRPCMGGAPFVPHASLQKKRNNIMDDKNCVERIRAAALSLRSGNGVLVVDDEDRENEGDLIYPAQTLTEAQVARLIRDCSGIICLCLTSEKVESLGLKMMAAENTSRFKTAFTVSIEAKDGVTTGVSARDRLTTIRTASADGCTLEMLSTPGHVFPLKANPAGVLGRAGHTEAVIDMMRISGLAPCGVLCELTNPDGTMARLPEIMAYGDRHGMPVISVQDIIRFRMENIRLDFSGEAV